VANFAESLQRQRFQSVNASAGVVVGLTYAYLEGRGRLPAWAPWAMLAFIAVRASLLVMYYRHNKRFYRDVRPCYAEHGRS
jgi:CHASE2 domain-containing sensor protein